MPWTEHTLYDGDVVVMFDEKRHQYKLKDAKKNLISVTSATGVMDKPALLYWVADCCGQFLEEYVTQYGHIGPAELRDVVPSMRKNWRTIRREAADVGKIIHEHAQHRFLRNEAGPKIPQEAEAGRDAFEEWRKVHLIEPRMLERVVYSQALGYTGTVDFLGKIDGRMTILDFKTGKPKKDGGVYDEMKIQLAGYRNAIEEEDPSLKINDSAILHFDKETGVPTMHQVGGTYERDLAAFINCLGIAEYQRGK